MTNWLSNLFKPDPRASQPVKSLGDIIQSGNNFEFVPASNQNPEHVVAHGAVPVAGQVLPIYTAITQKNGLEFSTNVGQVPNSPLGFVITDSLNNKFDRKFVTAVAQQSDKRDLLFTSQLPPELATQIGVQNELQEHAKVQSIVNPILNMVNSYGPINPQISHPSVVNIANNIVETNIDNQTRLLNNAQYSPVPILQKNIIGK